MGVTWLSMRRAYLCLASTRWDDASRCARSCATPRPPPPPATAYFAYKALHNTKLCIYSIFFSALYAIQYYLCFMCSSRLVVAGRGRACYVCVCNVPCLTWCLCSGAMVRCGAALNEHEHTTRSPNSQDVSYTHARDVGMLHAVVEPSSTKEHDLGEPAGQRGQRERVRFEARTVLADAIMWTTHCKSTLRSE